LQKFSNQFAGKILKKCTKRRTSLNELLQERLERQRAASRKRIKGFLEECKRWRIKLIKDELFERFWRLWQKSKKVVKT